MKKKITKLALLISGSALFLNAIRYSLNFLATFRHKLSQPNGRTYHWKFGDVYYTKKGKGSPILLLHDLSPASSSYEWQLIEDSLAMNHTVYTLDFPGCGRSEKLKISYTNYLYIQLLSDFSKEIIRQKTNVVAFGSSASTVLMLCKMDQRLFHNIGLVSPENLEKHYQPISFWSKLFRQVINLPLLGTLIYQCAYRKSSLKKYFYQNSTSETQSIDDYLIPYYREASHLGKSMGKYLYSSKACGYLNVNIIDALRTVNNNIYILYGEKDEEMKENAKQYAFHNPSIEIASIPNSRRYPQFDNPDAFLDTLRIYQ